MELPASLGSGKCFKPEAHLLIEKFLSLKKENSRDLFIANAVDLTSDRRRVSHYFFPCSEEPLQMLSFLMLNHFF